jgi:hypothetical protein
MTKRERESKTDRGRERQKDVEIWREEVTESGGARERERGRESKTERESTTSRERVRQRERD